MSQASSGSPSVVDSFLFYPKDAERVRFSCRSRGCNATIVVRDDASGKRVCRKQKHNHPNHERVIKNAVDLQRLRDEVKAPHNTYVPTKHVVSCVRRETRTCRRKSIDYRFARGSAREGHVLARRRTSS